MWYSWYSASFGGNCLRFLHHMRVPPGGHIWTVQRFFALLRIRLKGAFYLQGPVAAFAAPIPVVAADPVRVTAGRQNPIRINQRVRRPDVARRESVGRRLVRLG
jgi:hypothetical protein